MNKIINRMALCLLFTFFLMHAMENPGHELGPVHVVYSHAYCEESKRQFKDEPKKELPQNISQIMSFQKNKSFTSRSGNTIRIGDDDTTFVNSYAMKFAPLGQSLSVPTYPDESLHLSESVSKAVFYTKPAVISLAEHLHECINVEGKKRVIVVGPCLGASIATNCFKKLAQFDKDYFSGTSIESVDQAQSIINAVNNGGFVAIVPLLDVKKHNAIALPSALLSSLTFAAATTFAYSYGSDAIANDPEVAKLSLMSAGLLAYCATGDYVKNAYAHVIQHLIVPLLSRGNYDPSHESPIDIITDLKEVITGPVVFNFTEQDWVMEWADDDVIKLYEAFAGEKTHMVITNDKGHMEISPKLLEFLESFKEKYVQGNSEVDLSQTQPSIDEFKNKIYQYGIVSRMWASKKWAISFIMLLSVLPLYRVLFSQLSPA
jgi:hypothetical protein